MQLLLRGKGLWNIVSGKEQPPAETPEDAYLTFSQRRDVALTDILLSIEDNCSHTVISLNDPKEVWDKLNDVYKSVSDACVDTYLTKLQNLKMKDGEKMMSYVNRLIEIENELATVGHSLQENEKERALLRGLREEYLVTARVIRAMDMDFTKAVSELVMEEGSHEIEDVSEDVGSKALATVQPHSHGDKPCCSHCGREGHTADKCFHNPKSKCYPKNMRTRTGQSSKRRNQPHSSRNKKKGTRKDQDDDFANVAMVSKSKSVIRGEVALPPTMKDKWMVDSASTSHICNNASMFDELEEQPRRPVEVGEGQLVDVPGFGRIRGMCSVDGDTHEAVMEEVLYVPTMICNLMSVSKARKSGFKVVFDGDDVNNGYCEVVHKASGKVYVRGIELKEGLSQAVFKPHQKSMAFISSSAKQDIWHRRLAHVSTAVMSKTLPIVKGMDLSSVKTTSNQVCDDCEKGKSCRKPRPPATEESRNSTAPLDLVHADVVGPINHPSLSGKRYFIPLYDDDSAVSLVRFLRSKSEAGYAIKDIITDLETLRNHSVKQLKITTYEKGRVKRIRTDNAKELLSKSFTQWLQSKGITHELGSAYSPESNGKAERLNRTLLDMARTMLLSALHLPNHRRMWAEAVNAACYIRNRLFSSASSDPAKTPYQALLNKKPDISHIRAFGSKGFVHIPKAKRKGKFAERAQVGYVVGFERGNSYRVYIPEAGKVVVSRDVSIDETVVSRKETTTKDDSASELEDVQFDNPFESFLPHETPSVSPPTPSPETTVNHDDDDLQTAPPTHSGDDGDELPGNTVDALTHYLSCQQSRVSGGKQPAGRLVSLKEVSPSGREKEWKEREERRKKGGRW